jgi:hypothetical protein
MMSPLAMRIAERVRQEPPRWPVEAYAPGVISAVALDQAERTMGLRLPPIVRELYTCVRNGTFGPGGGLLPVGGKVDWNAGLTMESCLAFLRDYGNDAGEPSWVWPAGLVPLCHWGCEIWSCADCGSDPLAVIRWDPNRIGRDGEWRQAFDEEARSIGHWLEAWLDGTLRQ